jgi:hypothetical protein
MGSPGDSMMVVLRGTIPISVTPPKSRPHVLAILSPGEVFGEIAVLDGKARLADAIAMNDCSLAIIDRHDLLAFLEQNPGAWRGIVSVLCGQRRLRGGCYDRVDVGLLVPVADAADPSAPSVTLFKTRSTRQGYISFSRHAA